MNAREHAEAAQSALTWAKGDYREIAIAEALVAIALALTEPRPEPGLCLSWSADVPLDPRHPRHVCALHAGHLGAHHCNTCGADWNH